MPGLCPPGGTPGGGIGLLGGGAPGRGIGARGGGTGFLGGGAFGELGSSKPKSPRPRSSSSLDS